ncbi:hypothetical protein [Halorubrum trueperi]|uniref:Uncharacterized protein n=1 Tax=Halorubrum trueperi TaxID=2004704 RepID=A0ABD5UGT0_9EURY
MNRLAEETDLSWATVKKYTTLLETVSRITPAFDSSNDGIFVKGIGQNLRHLRGQNDFRLLLYILFQAEISGGPTEPIKISEHSDVLKRYEDEIGELHDLNLIEHDRESDTIRLQPEGIGMIGPVRSEIRNTNPIKTAESIELDPNVVGRWNSGSEYGGFSETVDRKSTSDDNNADYASTNFGTENASAY